MRWLSGITDSLSMNLSNLWEIVKDMEAWHAAAHGSQRVGQDLANEQQTRGKSLCLQEEGSPISGLLSHIIPGIGGVLFTYIYIYIVYNFMSQ